MNATIALNHFSKLIFFKSKPENIPYSIPTWCWLFSVCLAIDIYKLSFVLGYELSTYINTIKLVSFVFLLNWFLQRSNKSNRFIQTCSNILGVNIIGSILLLSIPAPAQYNQTLIVMVISWIFMIKLYIIRHSFEVERLKPILMTIAINVIPTILAITSISAIYELKAFFQ